LYKNTELGLEILKYIQWFLQYSIIIYIFFKCLKKK
jgi:hypothetical protein